VFGSIRSPLFVFDFNMVSEHVWTFFYLLLRFLLGCSCCCDPIFVSKKELNQRNIRDFFPMVYCGLENTFLGLSEHVLCTNYLYFVHILVHQTLWFLDLFFQKHFGNVWLVISLFCDRRTIVSRYVFSTTIWGFFIKWHHVFVTTEIGFLVSIIFWIFFTYGITFLWLQN